MMINENLKKTLQKYQMNPTLMKTDPPSELKDICACLKINNTSLALLETEGYDSKTLLWYDRVVLNEMRKDIGLPHCDMMLLLQWKQAHDDWYSANPVYTPAKLKVPTTDSSSAMIGHVWRGRVISGNNGTHTNNRKTYGNETLTPKKYRTVRGNRIYIDKPYAIVYGDYNNISRNAHHCTIKGDYNHVSGHNAGVNGDYNTIHEDAHHSAIYGDYNDICGSNCIIDGYYNKINECSHNNMTPSGTPIVTGRHMIVHDMKGNRIVMNAGRVITSDGDVVVEKKDVVMKPAHFLDAIKGVNDTTWIMGDGKEEECVICKENRRKIALKPCGHLHTCAGCTRIIVKCPVCRVQIVDTSVIFK